MKVLKVEMPDGSVWQVPLFIITEDNVDTYSDPATRTAIRNCYDRHPGIAIDWAENNMAWKDLAKYAKCIKPPKPVNYDKAWYDEETRKWIEDVVN